MSCDLCEAARLTEWFYEDDHCWIAECEACFVPMVVWKVHDVAPPEELRQMLHRRLLDVVTRLFDYEPYIDDNMRNVPDHYHAHARRRSGPWGRSPDRKAGSPEREH